MYYVHVAHCEPETGSEYETRAEAYARKSEISRSFFPHTITFKPTEEQIQTWQDRESQRFYYSSAIYRHVPWNDALLTKYYRNDLSADLFRTLETHYAHLSLDKTGSIAYTPDHEYGIADRQIRTTPGRYLEKFCSEIFTREQIADYIAECKSIDSDFKVADTVEDIRRVYVCDCCGTGNGPHSCMTDSISAYDCAPYHPTDVYAGSDLSIAYLGTLGKKITARAVIWPERKIYGTNRNGNVYGDYRTLEKLLEEAGYTKGTVRGARVRRIDLSDGRYVMPWIDMVDTGHVSGQWIKLGSGDLDVQTQDGVCGDREYHCADCGESIVDNDGDTCEYCQTHSCAHCESNDVSEAGDTCTRCDNSTFTCDHCQETFCTRHGEYFQYSDRNTDSGHYLCDACESDLACTCDDCCGTFYPEYETRGNNDLCEDCEDSRKEEEEEEETREPETVTAETLPDHLIGAYCGVVFCAMPGSDNLRATHCENVKDFAIHRTINRNGTLYTPFRWTVTHAQSGLSAGSDYPSYRMALDIALALTESAPIDWSKVHANSDLDFAEKDICLRLVNGVRGRYPGYLDQPYEAYTLGYHHTPRVAPVTVPVNDYDNPYPWPERLPNVAPETIQPF